MHTSTYVQKEDMISVSLILTWYEKHFQGYNIYNLGRGRMPLPAKYIRWGKVLLVLPFRFCVDCFVARLRYSWFVVTVSQS